MGCDMTPLKLSLLERKVIQLLRAKIEKAKEDKLYDTEIYVRVRYRGKRKSVGWTLGSRFIE